MLHVLTTDTAITLWWEKPAHPPEHYEVRLNGTASCSVIKTHCTINGLTPDTEYTIEVVRIGTVTVRTQPALRKIDVTLPPYNAKGDGVKINTAALQKAIDDCGENEYVYLPSGLYMTGALELHSRMTLCLDEGAVLQGTEDPADYLPKLWSRFEGKEQECYRSLLNLGKLDRNGGYTCEDVLICGGGTISGGGAALAQAIILTEQQRRQTEIDALGDEINTYEKPETIPGRMRGRLINMSNCRNIRLTNLTLQYGPSWNIHMVYSDQITTDHCTIRGRKVWNGDGWDPDSSTNCALFACTLQTTDDCVAIKSGKNPEGNIINRPTKHVRIFDCVAESGNGIAMGSEISGGIEDVIIWDCDLTNTNHGVEIKGTKKRGGYVCQVTVRDTSLPCMMAHTVLYNDDGIGAQTPPVFSDYVFENVRFTGQALDHADVWHDVPVIEMEGFDVPEHEVQHVVFRNCSVGRNAQMHLHHCKNVTIDLHEIN